MADALRRLSDGRVEIFFMCGNRDFLVGEDYCRRAGMRRIEEPARLKGFGHDALLMHGDALCTDDVAYQRFRRKVRNPAWQKRVLSCPVWVRRLLARLARWKSRRHTGQTEHMIMDVNAEAVARCFREHQTRRIIHGHTHRRAIHDLEIDSMHCQRIVLGDWHDTGSTLRVDENGIAMLTVARDEHERIELRRHETAAPLAGQ